MYSSRLQRLYQSMRAAGLDIVALNPGPTLYYLTGLSFHLMERPVIGLFRPDQLPVLLLPDLERPKAESGQVEVVPISYAEDEASRLAAFERAARAASLEGRRVGVEPVRLRYLELSLLQQAAPQAQFVAGGQALEAIRLNKDAGEIQAMRRAVQIAESAVQATLPALKADVQERQIAAELTLRLLQAGSESELPFAPIVASGPNSALPHAVAGDRKLQHGDLLILDWGAAYQGYISDLTRTYAFGSLSPDLVKIHQVVEQANAAGRKAAVPGASCGSVDQAARQVISRAGFGDFFIHRTGHGIGLEAHEAPYIRQDNSQLLQPGMTFTVEPGIYLAGKGGVRIEDDMLMTETAGESLSSLPRQLYTLE
jgi:Xaa-Pro dipeptidase